MLNLFNNSNNYSFFDNNLLSYGLILGSVSIISFSLYYFRGSIFKTYVDKGIQTTSNNLDEASQNTLNLLDKDVQNTSNNLDANIQTLPNHTDNFAQTSDAHIIEKIQEVLYGMCSEGENLSDIDPVTFANEIRNNPQYSGWFNSIQDWANDIKTSSGKSFNSSELEFLTRLKDELNSTSNSPIVEVLNTSSDPSNSVSQLSEAIIPQVDIEALKKVRFEEAMDYLNLSYSNIASDPTITNWVHSIINSYDYNQIISPTISSDIINKINCNIIIWSSGIF
jgi:hypothetical protein